MLTLKAPIQLSMRPAMVKTNDSMGRRIEANYQVLASTLSPENMLHFITDSAEVYMEGESMTSLVTVNNRINHQRINVELINNVMNRILLAERNSMSYQDRVFVDMVLNRMGITDVKQFMHQVTLMKSNTVNMSHLLELYTKDGDVIEELSQYMKNTKLQQMTTKLQPQRLIHTNTTIDMSRQVTQSNLMQTQELLSYKEEVNEDIHSVVDEYINEQQQHIHNAVTNQENTTKVNQKSRSEEHILQQQLEENTIENTTKLQQLETQIDQTAQTDVRLEQQVRQLQQEVQKEEQPPQYQDSHYELWLHQNILNRLDTGSIYQEIENYYKPATDTNRYIDINEYMVSEQWMQSQNIQLNQIKNKISYRNEPLEYRMFNTYELGDEQQEITEQNVTNELVEAVVLNALNQSYALRHNEINSRSDQWYDLTDSMQQNISNTMNRYEQYHNQEKTSIEAADIYNRAIQQEYTNEIEAIEQLYENHASTTLHTEGSPTTQTLVYQQENQLHGQQIQYLTKEEELLKQQLEQVQITNENKQHQLHQIINKIEPQAKLQINRAKAMEDARKALENPHKVVMEYLEKENSVERYEKETKKQLEKVIDPKVMQIFQQIEEYHKNPQLSQGSISANEAALETLILDTEKKEISAPEQYNENVIQNETAKTKELRSKELTSRIEKLVHKETTDRTYTTTPGQAEMLHKVTENGISEEVLEELKNVNRTVNRNVEEYTEQLQENQEIHRTHTNYVNHIELQDNQEISTMVANQVKDQIGNLSEQVYRRLEKRMDTEKRRRGL